MRWLCVVSVFFSAVLAFSVEPLTAKRLLPAFGGSAAVWVTCLVTFQGLLLLGYLYADLLLRAPRKAQLPVHGLVLALPFLVMPFAAPAPPPPDATPTGRLVLELLRGAALPFFALSTNATLVQHWYARRQGKAPWFLYAASNAGSLAGLLGYPLLVEPWVGLRAQASGWRLGYAVFAAITAWIALAAARDAVVTRPTSPAPSRAQVARWVTRSAIGAWLLTSVSFWVTLDVGALPLLWVLPLALYLLSFVLAFSPRVPFPRRILGIVTMLFVILGLESMIGLAGRGFFVLLAALGAVFCGTWLVHGDLARDRPAEERLSAYYLWIALGGFLGGLTGNVLAPQVFDTVAEYPIALAILAFAIAVEHDTRELRATLARPLTLALSLAMLAALVLTAFGFKASWGVYLTPLPALVLLVGVIGQRRLPGLFGVGAALTAIFLVFGWLRTFPSLDDDRSFYGTVRVSEKEGVRVMTHGTTIHGVEQLGGTAPPAVYYHPDGPLGTTMRFFADRARVGVIGLGAGALAVLSKPGQRVEFFEIDPLVERMARRWFTFLERSPAEVSVILGDARLTLGADPKGRYDGLIVDAFSSDSVPMHLLTREAVEMYLQKLEPGGVVVFHVSNRFFDLRRVVKGAADDAGAHVLWRGWKPDEDRKRRDLAVDTSAVALAASSAALASFAAGGWEPVDVEPLTWTDDASSLIPLLLDGGP